MEFYDSIQNNTLRAIYKGTVKVQRFISILLCIAVPCIVVYQVLLRYVFKAPLMGIEELLSFPIIWLYMLGGSCASEQRNHIDCAILTLYIKKEKSMKLFRVCRNAVSMVICAWLIRWSFWYFQYSIKMQKTSDLLHIPMVIGESAMFFGFCLMFIFGLVELIDCIMAYKNCLKEENAK